MKKIFFDQGCLFPVILDSCKPELVLNLSQSITFVFSFASAFACTLFSARILDFSVSRGGCGRSSVVVTGLACGVRSLGGSVSILSLGGDPGGLGGRLVDVTGQINDVVLLVFGVRSLVSLVSLLGGCTWLSTGGRFSFGDPLSLLVCLLSLLA